MQPIRMETNFEQFTSLLKIPDFDMLLMMAIGSRSILHEEISNIYKVKQNTYYETYKESAYYNDKRLASLSVQNYRAIQQFIGVYLYEQANKTTDTTNKLIKKGYRFVYQFVKNHLKVDLYKLRDDYINYVKKNAFEKNIHLAHLFGIALYLCKKFGKKIIFDEFDVNLIKNSIDQIFIELEVETEDTEQTEIFLEQYKQLGLMKDFNLPLKDLIISIHKFHQDKEEQVEMFEQDFYKGLSKVGLILQYCNINPLDLQNITNINHAKLKEIVSLSSSAIEMLELEEDIESVLGTYLLIYALATDYNLTKHSLIVTSQEEAQLELHQLRSKYEEEWEKLQKEEEQKQVHLHKLTESIETLQQHVHELETQLRKSNVEIEEQGEKIQSLTEERDELLSRLENEKNQYELPLEIGEISDFLNKGNCIIVGGLRSWQEQLKAYLPNARFIQPEELNIDLDFLLRADIVLFNEAVNNHAMFQKIKSKLESTTIPLCFSGKNTNMKLTLQKMYEALID